MTKKTKLTISDIASAAGVSKTTVSRYINGRKDLMSEKTGERIQTVIEMSNYHPSSIAQSLKTKSTKMIGVLMSDMSTPFCSALVIGIGDYLGKHGYDPLFVHCNDSIEKEADFIDTFIAKDVAGLLVNTTSINNPHLIKAACDGLPVVLCDRYINNYKFNIVTVEHTGAFFELITHLKDQGYTRPVLFTQRWENSSSRYRRMKSFISAVEKIYGYNPEDDIYVISRKLKTTPDEQLKKLMDRVNDNERVAIIGTNSDTTIRAYKAIKSSGLKIPTDIGLCGPEDWNWENDMNWPTLVSPEITTLHIPAIEMGKRSAKLLVKLIEGKITETVEELLPCELRLRQSTTLKSDT